MGKESITVELNLRVLREWPSIAIETHDTTHQMNPKGNFFKYRSKFYLQIHSSY